MSLFLTAEDRQKAVSKRLGEFIAALQADGGQPVAGAVVAVQWAPETGPEGVSADTSFGVSLQPALSKPVHIRILSHLQNVLPKAILEIKTKINTVLIKDREKAH